MIEEQKKQIEGLVKKNELIFGPIQECCNLYKRFCRCEQYKEYVKNITKNQPK